MIISHTSDVRVVADCLRHPACVGDVRRAVLRRLEQLALGCETQDTQMMESAVTGMAEPLAAGLLQVEREAQAMKERKFRTVWDAVDWLKKHYPEIDLEAPYKPREVNRET